MSKSSLIHHWVLALAASTLVGCGSSSENTASNSSSASSETSLASVPGQTPSSPGSGLDAARDEAARVVNQFLDRIRRGGGDNRADELLTTTARAEINRVGGVQTIGAPDSKFVVTRSQPAPTEDGSLMTDAMLVHSVWSDAGSEAEGTTETQVVWAVQQEFDQWRISGMAIELVPGQAPTIIDFENRNQMTQLFGQMSPEAGGQSDAPRQASLPSQGQSR